jgi:hypothetical protein
VIIIYRLDARKSILETEKTLKTPSSMRIYKKNKKNPKNPKKNKKPHSAGLKKKTGFFQQWFWMLLRLRILWKAEIKLLGYSPTKSSTIWTVSVY